MALLEPETQTCSQGILCWGQNTILISKASVIAIVIFGYVRDFKIAVESFMSRVYMHVLISTAFSYCDTRLEENGDLGVFHLARKVDLASDESDVILLKAKAFYKRPMCLFHCRITDNKRVNGKIRELSEIFSVIPITVVRILLVSWVISYTFGWSDPILGIFGDPSVIFVDFNFTLEKYDSLYAKEVNYEDKSNFFRKNIVKENYKSHQLSLNRHILTRCGKLPQLAKLKINISQLSKKRFFMFCKKYSDTHCLQTSLLGYLNFANHRTN